MAQGIRRDRRGCALRRFANRDVAGAKGLPGAGGRPRIVPERHRINPYPASPWCRMRSRDGGCSTAWWRPDARRSTPTPSTLVRSPSPAPRARTKTPIGYCPRRTVLDKLLVDAAAEAGAEIREEFVVEEIIVEGERAVGIKGRSKHGGSVTEHADIVVGADGRHSMVSEAVQRRAIQREAAAAGRLLQLLERAADGRPASKSISATGAHLPPLPTHDDLTLVIAGWPYAEFAENKKDIEGNYLKTIELAPAFARTPGAARRAKRRSPARRCRTISASHTAPAGLSWATPATTGISSPRREFSMPSATPNFALTALDKSFAGARPFEECNGRISAALATRGSERCMISPASSRRWSLRHPSCSSCLRRLTAIRRRWMDLHVSTPARYRQPSSLRQTISKRSLPPQPRGRPKQGPGRA